MPMLRHIWQSKTPIVPAALELDAKALENKDVCADIWPNSEVGEPTLKLVYYLEDIHGRREHNPVCGRIPRRRYR